MNIDTLLRALGSYFGEASLALFLHSVAVDGAPELPEGDDTTFLKKAEAGLELTFTGEQFMTVKLRKYPEGALVLTNVRFYGAGAGAEDFCPYTGELPYGLDFSATLDDLMKVLGAPGWKGPNGHRFRWDRDGHALFATLGAGGELQILAVQLPVKR
ncbi:hypothetical protein [Roseateles noduli]|uniref:hypothetical protein n=1 Tax=Roseateles noduli TaxID=2052484 RepID=UPI003D64774F